MEKALFSDAFEQDLPPGETALQTTFTIRVLGSHRRENGREIRTVLFSRTSHGETIEISAETDSPNLVAKLPDFLDAAMDLQRKLAQRRSSSLPSSFFPRFADESRLLRFLTDGRPSAERSEMERRRVTREATIVRDVAWEAIRRVLPPARQREIDALVGADETMDDLAASMDAVAAFIDAMLGDPEDVAILAACDIDTVYAAALRRHATVLRASMSEAEDGGDERGGPRPRVLRLIGMAYRARKADAFMAVGSAENAG